MTPNRKRAAGRGSSQGTKRASGRRTATDSARALPPILPSPRHVERRAGAFVLDGDIPIVLAPAADARDQVSAQRLRDGIAAACGLSLPIESHRRTADLGPRIELRIDEGIAAESDPARRRDAYRVEVQPTRVAITGGGPAGLRYGIETCLQLLDARGHLPGCRIDDAPRFAMRGIMLDVSRGKVPTPACIEALIDQAAALKLNVLMLYTEHTFRFRRHPEIGREDGSLDAETMRQLDGYARDRCVDLVPSLQSLGHMSQILKLPAYEALAETDRGWTLAPVEAGSYALLEDLYDEYLPNFSSSWFNANCDEPWDLGRGRSAARAEELGPGGLYLEHVRRVRELAGRHGKRTMIWGDVVHGHPERIAEIDRDLVLLDWWYEAEFAYDRVAVFEEHGIDFLVCPGTSSWNSLFPRIDNSQTNISRWAEAGRRHGALGLINTDWGDHGHYNLLGNSLFAYAWGAQESWSGACEAARFDRAFSRLVFGDSTAEVARLYRALGAVHDAGFRIFNGSPLQFLFFDSVESAYFIKACKAAALRRSLSRLEKLRPRILAAAARVRRERLALDELLYAADASLLALHKASAGLEYNAWRAAPERWRVADRRRLALRFRELADQQKGLGRRLRGLWLARSRSSNLDVTLRRLARSQRAMRTAARRLEQNRTSPAPGPEPITVAAVRVALLESMGGATLA